LALILTRRLTSRIEFGEHVFLKVMSQLGDMRYCTSVILHQEEAMSERDSKPTESVKTDADHRTSRRALLAAGAAAIAGAASAVVAPGTAKAHHPAGTNGTGPGVYEASLTSSPTDHGPKIPTVSYHPNDGLVSVIIRAWQNNNFKKKLLSFDETDDVSNLSTPPKYQRTKRRLELVGQVFIDQPVVITEDQYKAGYVKRDNAEVVFVLPNTPNDLVEGPETALGNSARALMAAVPFGM
jgi:hypothetical protein